MTINFVFDYETPAGKLMFGYQKNQLPEIISTLSGEEFDENSLIICDRKYSPSPTIEYARSVFVQGLISENDVQCNTVMTRNLKYLKQLDTSTFIVPFESVHYKTFFRDLERDDFNLDDCFSEELLKFIKTKNNFKLLFVDSREGSYYVDETPFRKIQSWLDSHNITGHGKVIFSTLDSNLKNHIPIDDRFTFYNNEFYIINSGRFVDEILNDENIIEGDRIRDNYHYDLKRNFSSESATHHYLMYNRNSSRLHRPFFVNKLIENDLFDKGKVSLHKSEEFERCISDKLPYEDISFTDKEIESLQRMIKSYPFTIDEEDGEKIAHLHNYLSNKEDYESTLFSIVGETSSSNRHLFITEKTMKPIMNLHPFFVYGNPGTLKRLQEFGFKTFSDVWNENYDLEVDSKKRAQMIIDEVSKLCELSLTDLKKLLEKTKNICIYNREHLLKLHYENKGFFMFSQLLKKTLV